VAALSEQQPDTSKYIRAEAEAQRQLAAANQLLTQFRSTYGEPSRLPPDSRQLAERLRLKEEEVKSLRSQDEQHADAETTLYDEIGKLSTAWESLQAQVTSKVFDLVAAEERITKANLDVSPAQLLTYIRRSSTTSSKFRKPRRTTNFLRLCVKRRPSRMSTSTSHGQTKSSLNTSLI
jgi:hypothetical protein